MLILLSLMGRTNMPVVTQGDDLDYPDKRHHCERVVERLGFMDYTYAYSDVSAIDQLGTGDGEGISGTFTHVVTRYRRERRRDGVIMGLRSEESKGRKKLVNLRGPIYYRSDKGDDTQHLCCIPIHDWSGEDVFSLILSTDTPYMHVYDNDDYRMPHEIRFSWMTAPEFWRRGDVSHLRRYYPELYNRLANHYPQIARYT